MRRICIVRHGYYPADPRVRKEAEALASTGWDVDVICLRRETEKPRDSLNGVNVYRLPLAHRRRGVGSYLIEYALSFMLCFLWLNVLNLRKRYKVIQINTLPDFLVFICAIPKILGVKVLLDMHEAMPELLRSKFGLGEHHPWVKLARLVENLSTRFADHVLAVNWPILDLYASRGLSVSKATVVPNVPDEKLFDYRKYRQNQATTNGLTLISHGSVLERYGFQLLIKAVSHVRELLPMTNLIILGEGEYLGSLIELADSLHLGDWVVFAGRIPLEQVPAIISCVDVGVVPVLNDEFTNLMAPNKLFEYVAMRKPVVATRTDGMQSYFDSSCVMFFESGNERELAKCILDLFQNPPKRRRIVRNAWQRYQSIRWSATKQEYLAVIERMLGDGHSVVSEGHIGSNIQQLTRNT